jgi:hypothetical protein
MIRRFYTTLESRFSSFTPFLKGVKNRSAAELVEDKIYLLPPIGGLGVNKLIFKRN